VPDPVEHRRHGQPPGEAAEVADDVEERDGALGDVDLVQDDHRQQGEDPVVAERLCEVEQRPEGEAPPVAPEELAETLAPPHLGRLGGRGEREPGPTAGPGLQGGEDLLGFVVAAAGDEPPG
jgi:hypothetical protein